MTESQPALNVIDVVKSYGATRALDGINLQVRPGEFVILLGPNGAGKSTLFQLLTGLFVADEGQIIVDGHDLAVNSVPALGGLGIVFQTPTLDPELSINANLRFHTDLHGVPAKVAQKRIDEELERIGLGGKSKQPVRTLSGGNKRRVELARALLHEPKILLMDEPTVGLDHRSRQDILQSVEVMRRDRNLAVLWATHLVDEAKSASRVVILHQGKILNDGPIDTLVKEQGTKDLSEAFLKLTADPDEAAVA
jgi:ABC-2 type transport system ATP-binding protein